MAKPFKQRMTIRYALGALCTLLPVFLVGCGHGNGRAKEDTTTITEAVASLPSSYAYDAGDFTYAGFEFEINTNAQLVRNPYIRSKSGDLEQDNFHFVGALAESYDVSPDGLIYTFHLRHGVLSQAGHELTVDDVLYSYERKWHSTSVAPFISSPAIIDPAKQFKKLGRYDMSITVDRAGDGFTLLALLAHVSGDIYDSTLLKQHATESDPYAVQWSASHGNYGFGAYNLKEFIPGLQLVLVANPNYYAGAPKIKKIVEQLVLDPGTRANLVKNGDVDIATALLPSDIASFDSSSGVKTFDIDSILFVDLRFNTGAGPFKDRALRQAMRYAVPYRRIIDQVYRGRGVGQKGFLNPRYPGANDAGLEPNYYDPAKARQILRDAGYILPVSFTITISNAAPDIQQVAMQILSAASDAGMVVKLRLLPSAGATQAFYSHNFEAFVKTEQSISQSPAYELMLEFTPGSPLNASSWHSDQYMAAVSQGVGQGNPLTPQAGRWWDTAQQIWQAEAPDVPIAFVQPTCAFGSRIRGYADRSESVIDFANLSFTN